MSMWRRKNSSALTSRFIKDISGQFAVWFALLAVPLLGVTTFVIDYRKSEATKTQISDALDSAALASVTLQNVTEAERGQYAEDVFWDIVPKSNHIDFTVMEAASTRVELTANARTPTSVMRAMGVKDIKTESASTAVLTYGDVVCALALDPSGAEAFKVVQGGIFKAPNCSVQVNSTHLQAAKVTTGGQAIAKDFCTSGGAVGRYSPHVNTQCSTVADPYSNRRAPLETPCLDPRAVQRVLNQWWSTSTGVTLKPGTYCGGLYLMSHIVTFEPGVYTFKDGPLVLDAGSRLMGKGVSFVMSGDDATVEIKNGSKINISAPKTGPLAGLAIFQDVSKSRKKLGTGHKVKESIFQSGGNLNITGTVYLPEQHIVFINGGSLTAQAPATSFIGHNITVTQGAVVQVNIDHVAAGLPPIEPRSDEGARLVK